MFPATGTLFCPWYVVPTPATLLVTSITSILSTRLPPLTQDSDVWGT